MKILHILRSAPTELVRFFVGAASGKESKQVALYEGGVDYDRLIADIFESDQVICWW